MCNEFIIHISKSSTCTWSLNALLMSKRRLCVCVCVSSQKCLLCELGFYLITWSVYLSLTASSLLLAGAFECLGIACWARVYTAALVVMLFCAQLSSVRWLSTFSLSHGPPVHPDRFSPIRHLIIIKDLITCERILDIFLVQYWIWCAACDSHWH